MKRKNHQKLLLYILISFHMWWTDCVEPNTADMKKSKKCRNKFSTLQKLVHELKRKGKYSFEVNKYQSRNKYEDSLKKSL